LIALRTAEYAGLGNLRATLSSADARLRASEGRSCEAEARVARLEAVLATHQGELASVRRLAAVSDPVTATSLQRQIEHMESRWSAELDAVRRAGGPEAAGAMAAAFRREVTDAEARVSDQTSSLRREVDGLRVALQRADPSIVASLTATLRTSEDRLAAAEARVASADRRAAAVEAALLDQRREIDVMKRAADNSDPAAATAIRREIAAAEARFADDAAWLRRELESVRSSVRRVGDPGAAEQRAFEIERRVATAEARLVEDTANLRREMVGLRDVLTRPASPPPPPPRNRGVERRGRYTSDDGSGTDASDESVGVRHRRERERPTTEPEDVGIDRLEFYLRGSRAIEFWSARGVGSSQTLTELFKLYWNKLIVGRLTGSDAAQAGAMVTVLLLACRDYANGELRADTARALSSSVTFVTAKAGYGAHKATVICDLLKQDALDPQFKRVVQAAATIVNRDAPRPGTYERYQRGRDVRPDAARSGRGSFASPNGRPNGQQRDMSNARPRTRSSSPRAQQQHAHGGRGRGGRGRGRTARGDQPTK
jgi:hypothetical protein